MIPRKLTREWRDALDDLDVAGAVQAVQARWPNLPLPLLLRAVLSAWCSHDRDSQVYWVTNILGVDLDEAAADQMQAGEEADHG